jgi:hypothetical protein
MAGPLPLWYNAWKGWEKNMINLLCGQDLEKLGIMSRGTWNMLAFWDHLDACDHCREGKTTLVVELDKVIGGLRQARKETDV